MTSDQHCQHLHSTISELQGVDCAHVDGGAQSSVAGDEDLIWHMQCASSNAPKLIVADGKSHQPVHEGHLCTPNPHVPEG